MVKSVGFVEGDGLWIYSTSGEGEPEFLNFLEVQDYVCFSPSDAEILAGRKFRPGRLPLVDSQ